MRLSTVIELLLILLLVAFAAYGRVIDRDEIDHHRVTRAVKQQASKQTLLSTMSLKQATDSVNKYCTCSEDICNCCRDFHIPLVQLKGPGCASLQYQKGDNLAVQLSFGDNILTSTIVNGKNPKPVCVPLPGGYSKFCGRVYSIQRDANRHFKACLGLELQSSTELEASLRVSCFRFGPDGLKLRPAEPLPVVEAEVPEEDDEDEDFFDLGPDDDDDDEDDEDDEEDKPEANAVATSTSEEADDDEEDDDDVLGLGALLDAIIGSDETATKKPKVTTPPPRLEFTIPILTRPTTAATPIEESAPSAQEADTPQSEGFEVVGEHVEGITEYPENVEYSESSEHPGYLLSEESNDDVTESIAEASNKVAFVVKPSKVVAANKVKKVVDGSKKPSITSGSVNFINSNANKKKPITKPIEDDDDEDDVLGSDDLDEEDEDEEILGSDEDDEEDEKDEDEDEDESDDDDEDEKIHDEQEDDEDEKAEDIDDLDDDDDEDDDDEEEDAVLSALVTGGSKKSKKNKVTNHSASQEEEDSDYSIGIEDILARNRHARNATRSSRQSRVMRL